MGHLETIVPDTSILIEGLTSKGVLSGDLKPREIIVHNASVDELEQQANKGRETGYLGLEEIRHLRELSHKHGFTLEFKGPQPNEFQIRHAKDGAIDDMIRTLAAELGATLYTADRVQSLVADAQGISVHYVQFDVATRTDTPLDEFFTDQTMSVHLIEDAQSVRKVGKPGAWSFEPIERPLNRHDVQNIAKQLIEIAGARRDSYIEQERMGSVIMQIARYRIVVAKPPFASGWEITAVRPVRTLTLDDYELSQKLLNRLDKKAEGVLIAGAPGSGKSTFVQAVAAFYTTKNKIVKTVEAPRDLVVPKEVTQYSLSNSSEQEIRDVLLLNRPDYTIFDEMRNTHHFQLFADLRLAGVGMLGVVHATKPIDAIQRFLGRIELGVIPHIVDTVIFIQAGGPKKVFTIDMEVKVPSGMMEADLARPVVCIYDFESEKLEYEVYTFGEQTVVMPVSDSDSASPALKLASQSVKEYFYRYTDQVEVEMPGANKAVVYVPKSAMAAIIGTGGKNIQETESRLGISINIREMSEHKGSKSEGRGKKQAEPLYTQPPIRFDIEFSKKNITIEVSRQYAGRDVDLYDRDKYLLTATVNKKGLLKFSPDSGQGATILHAAKHGKLELRG